MKTFLIKKSVVLLGFANLEALVGNKSYATPMTHELNVSCGESYENDIGNTERNRIEMLAPSFGLSQFIFEPTYILHQSKSYIELIFVVHPNKVGEPRVYSLLHYNRHQKTVTNL